MKQLDKLKNAFHSKLKQNKKIFSIICLLFIIGFIAGTVFMTILSKTDQSYVKDYMTSYIGNIKENQLNYLSCFMNAFLSNFILFISVFLLGISVIGIPFILFIYFFKSFILGFSVTSFILSFGAKGILYTIIYIIPNLLIYILFTILVIYALKISIYFIYSIFNKLDINSKVIMNGYLKILLFSIVGIILYSVLETFVTPYFIQLISI